MTRPPNDLRTRFAAALAVISTLTAFALWPAPSELEDSARDPAAVCNLALKWNASCYRRHQDNVYKLLFVHYGNNGNPEELRRIADLFQERVNQVQSLLRIEVNATLLVTLKKREMDLEAVRANLKGGGPELNTPARLERLWYTYNPTVNIFNELHEQLLKQGHKQILSETDGVVVLSEPQFEGLALAKYAAALIEYPSERAWELPDGGTTLWPSDNYLMDQILHEFGHVLGLRHVANHCFENKLLITKEQIEEMKSCCDASPGKDDVMSYCRDRTATQNGKVFGFTACPTEYLEKKMLNQFKYGKTRIVQQYWCP